MEEKLIRLLISFLGDYGKHCGDWYSFNCPCCAENKGVEFDNKFNLEINVTPQVLSYHCWRCGDTDGMRGRISSLIKKYGGKLIYDEYKNILDEYRQSQLFSLSGNEQNAINDNITDVESIQLPKGFKLIEDNDLLAKDAIEYLKKRNVNNNIIQQYKIGYIPNDSHYDFSTRGRIIVPSYNQFGELNYWVGRDYTGKNKVRYMNPKVEKTKFIFNEYYVNWYEDVILVEGVFDHIVTPNSIPLLGKNLNSEFSLYNTLISKARSKVVIFLDDDAFDNAKRIYKSLYNTSLRDNLYVIIPPDGYDASLIYQEQGHKGIVNLMLQAKKLTEYDLLN